MNARNFSCIVLLIALMATTAFARKWTDASGKHSTEADFVEVKDGNAILKKTNGKVISVPLEKLSAVDQEFIKSKSNPKERKAVAGKEAAGDRITKEHQTRQPNNAPWQLSKPKYEKLVGTFSSGEFNNAYVIQPADGRALVKATLKISATIPDKEAIEKYNKASSNLSEEEQKTLTKDYRFFSTRNLKLTNPSGLESHAVYLNKPRAFSEVKIGANGQAVLAVTGGSPKGWLHSEALWVADGATIGKEKITIDSGENKYLALVELAAEPVEIEAIFIVDAKVTLDDVQITID
jgi:hypothetical protein